MRGPKPLPKRVLHRVRCSVSSFSSQYPLFSLRSSSGFLRLLPRSPFTPILTSIFPSITYFIRQFLPKMWPIQLAFFLFIVCGMFLSSFTLCHISSFFTRSVRLIFSILLQHISKFSRYFWSTIRVYKFQHHTKLCSKCSTFIFLSLCMCT